MEELLKYYANNPKATNAEAAEALGKDEGTLRVYKNRLKKRGFIAITEELGVIVLREYGQKEAEQDEIFDFKQDISAVYHEQSRFPSQRKGFLSDKRLS